MPFRSYSWQFLFLLVWWLRTERHHSIAAAFLIRPLSTSSTACSPFTIRESASTRRKVTLSNDEVARYSRHLVLSDVGVAGQLALKEAAVLVIGAGGLGSPALMYLAAAGVGHVGIVDADTVDSSNLQRQIIHGTSTVGVSKCQSAAARMADLNPFVKVRIYEQEFTADTATEIVQGGFGPDKPYDLILDGSDNFPTKYLINDVCSIEGLPWVYAAILAFEGQISVLNYPPGKGPDYRDLLPTPPPPGDVPSCAEGGVLGVLPGILGCLQATEAIKILLGHTSSDQLLAGRVLVVDAMHMSFKEMGLVRASEREPITGLIDYQGFCGGPQTKATGTNTATATPGARTMDEAESDASLPISQAGSFHSIEPADCLERMLTEGWSPWVLDVRLPTEHEIVALPFTDRVRPHRTVRIHDVPKTGDVLVYCKAGVRGKKACDQLIQQGVEPDRLYNLNGGIMKWQKEVDPSMPRY